MYQMNFEKPQAVHFIGIGGISMSGLAEILMKEGFSVSGSDAHESPLTKILEEKGAVVYIGQRAENITDKVEVVVYTAAIHPDNPEYAEAVRRGLPLLSRAELLGQIMKNYDQAIAIAGTHGKTTTTSMVSEVCMRAGLDPTITVGGMLHSIGGNIRIGSSACFIAEACEYTNSFLSFFPSIAVILNIREDHLDFFKDLDDIRASFRRFASLVPEKGLVVIGGEIDNWQGIVEGLPSQVVTFGFVNEEKGRQPGAFTYMADHVELLGEGGSRFEVWKKGELLGTFRLHVPGIHNVSNALAAIAVTDHLGVPVKEIAEGLSGYTGVERRFEKKGEKNGVAIYDDYAHHPDEIEATLRMANQVKKGTLWCVFQPHTYSRTKALLPEFAEALSLADEVILADIYAARETDTLGVSSEDIVRILQEKGKSARFLPTFPEIEKFIEEHARQNDMLITMGAGDVVKVGENLLAR